MYLVVLVVQFWGVYKGPSKPVTLKIRKTHQAVIRGVSQINQARPQFLLPAPH